MKSAAFAIFLGALAAPAVARQGVPPMPDRQASAAEAGAEATERLALAREFAAATLSEEQVMEEFRLAATAGLEASLAKQAAERAHAALARESLEEVLRESEPIVRRSAQSMSAAYARVYASEFTAAEVRDMVSFARTSGGRRYLTRGDSLVLHPEIAAQSAALETELAPIVSAMQSRLCQRLAATHLAEGKRAKCQSTEKG